MISASTNPPTSAATSGSPHAANSGVSQWCTAGLVIAPERQRADGDAELGSGQQQGQLRGAAQRGAGRPAGRGGVLEAVPLGGDQGELDRDEEGAQRDERDGRDEHHDRVVGHRAVLGDGRCRGGGVGQCQAHAGGDVPVDGEDLHLEDRRRGSSSRTRSAGSGGSSISRVVAHLGQAAVVGDDQAGDRLVVAARAGRDRAPARPRRRGRRPASPRAVALDRHVRRRSPRRARRSISPTSSSARSSRVITPAKPPYSSTTQAIWLSPAVSWRSTSGSGRSGARRPGPAGRSRSTGAVSGSVAASRSARCTTPTTSSVSSVERPGSGSGRAPCARGTSPIVSASATASTRERGIIACSTVRSREVEDPVEQHRQLDRQVAALAGVARRCARGRAAVAECSTSCTGSIRSARSSRFDDWSKIQMSQPNTFR